MGRTCSSTVSRCWDASRRSERVEPKRFWRWRAWPGRSCTARCVLSAAGNSCCRTGSSGIARSASLRPGRSSRPEAHRASPTVDGQTYSPASDGVKPDPPVEATRTTLIGTDARFLSLCRTALVTTTECRCRHLYINRIIRLDSCEVIFMTRISRRTYCGLALASVLGLSLSATAQVDPSLYAGLKWRNVGPFPRRPRLVRHWRHRPKRRVLRWYSPRRHLENHQCRRYLVPHLRPADERG